MSFVDGAAHLAPLRLRRGLCCLAVSFCVPLGGCDRGADAKGAEAKAPAEAPAEAPSGPAAAANDEPAATAGAAEGEPKAVAAGTCTKLAQPAPDQIRLVSKAAAVGSDIDLSFDLGTGRVSGVAYKMTQATLEATQPDYAATPEQTDAFKALVSELCVEAAASSGEAPKGFVRYGLVGADGSARWLVAEGLAAGLPAGEAFFPVPTDTFKALSQAWPRQP